MKSIVTSFFVSFCFLVVNAQHFPGGVTNAEVWIVMDNQQLATGSFLNFADSKVRVASCGDYEPFLFNFNPSMLSEKLCLKYIAKLENTNGKNHFFVGAPKDAQTSWSNIGTLWNDLLPQNPFSDSIVRNFHDFNTLNLYGQKLYDDYASDKNAHINYFRFQNYNVDRKFNSFGQNGETAFYIGKPTQFDAITNYDDAYFNGNFPEFISFTRELTQNERNRVESYLALKYGITLSIESSYKNSKNTVFWNKTNNGLFPNRIFGFGRDDVSNLNQLQSESSHLKDFLIGAIGEIMVDNVHKQEDVEIPKDHFIVFGDNGGGLALINGNSDHVRLPDRVWLSQNTGEASSEYPVDFKFYLPQDFIDNYHPGHYTIWLLQDRHVDNTFVSDFDNSLIKYYEAADVDLGAGTAYFKNVFFDEDANIYDQFTFGLGPKFIVQVSFQGCKDDKLLATITINGGEAPYRITIIGSDGSEQVFYIQENEMQLIVDIDVSYNIEVFDNTSLSAMIDFMPVPWNFSLNFDSTYQINDSMSPLVLDASVGITDPMATYQWYFNENLLTFNGGQLTVEAPGIYQVVVTSEDQSCAVTAETLVINDFAATFSNIKGCSEEYNSLTVIVTGGFSPYVTSLIAADGSVFNHVHSGTTTISEIPYGIYDIVVTDNMGGTVTTQMEFAHPGTGFPQLDVIAQLEANPFVNSVNYIYLPQPFFEINVNSSEPIIIYANTLVGNNSNILYEWYVNGYLISTASSVALTKSPDCYLDYPSQGNNGNNFEMKIVVTDSLTGCSYEEIFYSKDFCLSEIENINPELTRLVSESVDEGTEKGLHTKVYPNPSQSGAEFYYEISSTETFDGVVEIFSVSGALLNTMKIGGASKYILPYNLLTSGTYLIKLTTTKGEISTNRIIIK